MKHYNPKIVERKWQSFWQTKKIFVAKDGSKVASSATRRRGGKKFVIFEFPYPSGKGLHVGHMRPYLASDIYSRLQRLKGFETLYPMGWDAFGLPAENFAIKNGIHPSITTAKNIANAKKQMQSWGLGLDWSREINTTDPNYYKWTQWIFLQLFKHGLAYEATGPINWCPKDKCGLANEEVIDSKCERCGTVVEKREMRQWFLKITAYAEKLLDGLKHLPEWPDAVKVQQENWIGKSTGALIKFPISNTQFPIEVFTTRPDTIFGTTYLVVAPEHGIISDLRLQIANWAEVQKYIEETKKKSEMARTDATKEKTGVELKGVKVINPATKEEIPVWVADYVLGNYGTGAIMAVPAHDERDFEFAKKFGLPIREVIQPLFINTSGSDAVRRDLPLQEREVIVAIVKHWEKNLYLGLKWKKVDWRTFVVGGIEQNENPVAAATREIQEETGYQNPKFIKELGIMHSQFYHVLKQENRFAHFHGLLFQLKDDGVVPLSIEESAIHEVKWLEADEVAKFIEKEDMRVLWERLNGIDAYTGRGVLIGSGKFTGMKSDEAIPKMAAEFGKATVQYKLHDWLFSRQRYWGEPIPIVHCAVCATRTHADNRDADSRGTTPLSPPLKRGEIRAEFYFPSNAYWEDIARGYKNVETRSFDPKGENKAWADIKSGDTVSLLNKKTKQKFLARVLEVKHFKNFLELYKNQSWLAQVFPGRKFKSPVDVELAYKKIYKGYPGQVFRYGLTAWKIQVETVPVALSEKDLPLKLPAVKKYEPTGTGESPLAQVTNWVNTKCPSCHGPARRETNTMPQWAGSSWYWLRYTDPKNKKELASKSKLRYWTPVDIYFGGMEHTTLHLLYSRFWNLFLHDIKVVPTKEPYTKRVPHGIILGPDGDKMSKSKGNVVNPDEIVKQYGADTLRMYEMFLGPHEAQVAWNDKGVVGVRRFLERVWGWIHKSGYRLQVTGYSKTKKQTSHPKPLTSNPEVERALHKLIKKVGEDIENFRFNTCVSAYMEFLNAVKDLPVTFDQARLFLIVLYPFAPHIAEELNIVLGGKKSLQLEAWPKFNPRLVKESSVALVVQVNGKVRDKIVAPVGSSEAQVQEQILKLEKIKSALAGAEIKRAIFVQDRLINLVV